MLECEMMEKCYSYLMSTEEVVDIKQEVPFLSRCIDIVFIDKENEVVSIELKIHDWRHAIEQAKNHKLGADKAYICLPKRRLTNELENELHNTGIGLFFYNDDEKKMMYEVISASNESTNVKAFKELLISNMKRI